MCLLPRASRRIVERCKGSPYLDRGGGLDEPLLGLVHGVPVLPIAQRYRPQRVGAEHVQAHLRAEPVLGVEPLARAHQLLFRRGRWQQQHETRVGELVVRESLRFGVVRATPVFDSSDSIPESTRAREIEK